MSDKLARELERAWIVSGAVEDGEAWVRELVRQNPPDPLRIVSMLIQFRRAFEAVCKGTSPDSAIRMPVTPLDMARWIRGERASIPPRAPALSPVDWLVVLNARIEGQGNGDGNCDSWAEITAPVSTTSRGMPVSIVALPPGNYSRATVEFLFEGRGHAGIYELDECLSGEDLHALTSSPCVLTLDRCVTDPVFKVMAAE